MGFVMGRPFALDVLAHGQLLALSRNRKDANTMSDPKTRALEHLRLAEAYLNDRSEVMDWHVHVAEELQALRLAITQIPTTSWQPMATALVYPEAHEFLVWHASHGCAYIVEWHSAQLLQDDCGNPMDLAACSHWAPLTPPKQPVPSPNPATS